MAEDGKAPVPADPPAAEAVEGAAEQAGVLALLGEPAVHQLAHVGVRPPQPLGVHCDLGPARGTTVPYRNPGGHGPVVHVALDGDTERAAAEILHRLCTLG